MKEMNAQEAYDLLQKDPDYLYLDVRSVPEFEQGHPIKAINIPLLHFVAGMGMLPNDDFVAVVEASLPKDAKLLVSCKTGDELLFSFRVSVQFNDLKHGVWLPAPVFFLEF